jgi:photosystem II stability/assembly factor-like uncharacterized protein
MNKKVLLFALFIIAVNYKITATAQVSSQPYQWKSVQMRGGGFVDGVVYHPTEKNLLYCRTDMGGAYKWNEELKSWEPLLDWVSYNDRNLMGVESIALDVNDPNRLYMACGTYTTVVGGPNAILRSDDRGKTFKRTDVPFRMGGNENGRGNGERMQVDPNNSNILFMGTRIDGLWKSEDAAVTWSRVSSFPEIVIPAADTIRVPRGRYRPRPNGIIFVVFDLKSKAGNKSAVIFAGTSQKGKENLFRSTDGGSTWLQIPGEPTDLMPTHAILSSDGILYITYGTNPGPDVMTDGAVYKYNTTNNQWTNITPLKPNSENEAGFGYAAVAVDVQHPQTLIVSTFHRYGKAGNDDIFRSLDAGATWKPVFTGGGGGKYDYIDAPYVSHTGIHWLFDMEIDPFNSDHAIFTTGYGLHETFDLTDVDKGKPTTWGTKNKGIEETVALELLSPPKGVPLISAIGDYGGFVHQNLDEPAPEGNFINPHFANTDAVTCGWQNSNVVVRVGEGSSQVGGGNIGYSLDGGKTWQPTTSTPQADSKHGFICVSTSGNIWIWTPQRSAPYITSDKGATWKQIQGLPNNTRIIADPLNNAKFYAMDLFNGKLFISTDNGNSFTVQDFHLPNGLPDRNSNRGDIRGGQDRIYAAPGKEGDLWIATFDGLYHTKNISDFEQISGVTEIHAFGFGKAAPKSNYAALYLAGTINGVDGIFRSDDKGKNWVRINDDAHRWSLILQITGDPKKYGRVYVGTHGRGTLYGDINQSK